MTATRSSESRRSQNSRSDRPVEVMSLYYVGIMTVVGLLVATWAYRRYARYVPLWI